MKKGIAFVSAIVLLVAMIMISPMVSAATIKRGDANQDGNINMKDILMIRQQMAGMNPSGINLQAADANGDNGVNMKDILLIRKYMARLDVSFGPDIIDSTTSTIIPTTTTTSATTSSTTSQVTPVTNVDLIPDQITLSYYDSSCTQLGCTWHVYKSGSKQVLQYVQSDSANADFSNATTVDATETMYTTKGMDYDVLTNTFTFGNPVNFNDYCQQVVLKDLQPGKTYAYRVGDKNTNIWSSVATFTTRDTSSGAFSFVNITDTQVSDTVASDIAKYTNNAFKGALSIDSTPDFILHNGDIVQRSGWLQQWRCYFNGASDIFRKYPTVPVTGNHDSTYDTAGEYEMIKHFKIDYPSSNDATNYGIYYSFDYSNAHFVVLNTDNFKSSKGCIDEKQYQWLENDLKSNTKQWTIVCIHRPIACLRDKSTPDESRNQLINILNQYNVDLVIMGHEHLFEYTYPIASDSEVLKDSNTRTEDGATYYVNPKGVVCYTAATAGSDGKAPYDGMNESLFATFQKGVSPSWSNVTIDGNKLTVGVYYYSDGVKNYSNNQFGIIKE